MGGAGVLGALFAWLAVPSGFANYDTAYALVWGADLAHGRSPDLTGPLAPTAHPLATLAGLLLAPLGAGAETAIVVLAYLALGAVCALTVLLGARTFGLAAGALAAAIVITREPILSYGARAYVDLPYLALVLGAACVEAGRARAGTPVLVLLGVAGLLRPEAWLLSGAYVLWCGVSPARVALAAAAPIAWLAVDWALAGDPLHSLIDTRAHARTLGRVTGLENVPLTVPRRLGEILREPVLLGAALGGPLALWLRRDRARIPVAAGVIALVAFCVLAAAGLPILGRYLMLPAVVLALCCGEALAGWRSLPAGHPWRRRWKVGATIVGVALLAFVPAQAARLRHLRGTLHVQRAIRDDLRAIATRAPCTPYGVPNHRPVPLLALWRDVRPSAVVAGPVSHGSFFAPANARVRRNFLLDPRDPVPHIAEAPNGFTPVAANRSWWLLARC